MVALDASADGQSAGTIGWHSGFAACTVVLKRRLSSHLGARFGAGPRRTTTPVWP